jgi:hypothetical protein
MMQKRQSDSLHSLLTLLGRLRHGLYLLSLIAGDIKEEKDNLKPFSDLTLEVFLL